MIKQFAGWKVLSLFFILLSALFIGCAKDDGNDPDPQLDFREYKLYNYSCGTEAEAGSFRIDQLKDGSARLTVSLAEPYRQNRISCNAVIHTKAKADHDLVCSYRGAVHGGTGNLVIDRVA